MIRWTGPARGDLAELRAFLAERDPLSASRATLAVLDRVEWLAARANMGRPGRVNGTREWSLRRPPYIIVYRVVGDDVEILRILHTARDRPPAMP